MKNEQPVTAEVCGHFWVWVSPHGTNHSARICGVCHEPDAAWLNEVNPANSGEADDERRKSVLHNDIAYAPTKVHILLSDRLIMRDYLWEQGWRRDVRPEDVNDRRVTS